MDIRPPVRVARRWTQHLDAPPDRVFPLLCPVREAEWVEGWDPSVVFTESGLVEPDCVFVTGGAVWVTTRHDPEARSLGLLKVVPDETVCRIDIDVAPRGDGGSDATVRYALTALTPAGEETVRDFTADAWAEFMTRWETAIGRHLARPTG